MQKKVEKIEGVLLQNQEEFKRKKWDRRWTQKALDVLFGNGQGVVSVCRGKRGVIISEKEHLRYAEWALFINQQIIIVILIFTAHKPTFLETTPTPMTTMPKAGPKHQLQVPLKQPEGRM